MKHSRILTALGFLCSASLVSGCVAGGSSSSSSLDLEQRVQQQDPSIGQTTVYRTLKLLCEAGLAMEIHFSDGIARYELAASDSHHDHMVCVACGKVIEIYDPRIEKIQHELADKYDFLLRGHVHNLYGICSACAAQEQRERQKGGAPATSESDE